MNMRSTVLLAGILSPVPAGAVQPYVGEMQSYVLASMANEQVQDYGFGNQSWGLANDPKPPTPIPLSTAVDALATDIQTGGTIATTLRSSSQLTGPLTGTMKLTGTLNARAPDPSDAGQRALFQSYMVLRYLSEGDRDADIAVNYTLSSVNPGLFAANGGLNFWVIGWWVESEILGNVGQNRAGIFNAHCPARNACWLTIGANSDLAAAHLPVGYGSFSGQFDWTITENRDVLPEPEIWVMLIGGFVAAGTVLRSRRATIAASSSPA